MAEFPRHIGKYECHYCQRSDAATKILGINFVESIRIRMVPFKVVLACGEQAQRWDTVFR